MNENNGSDIGAFMAGFVIGGLVGAATALILAPQSGEETRSQIASRGADLRMAGEERIGEYRSIASDAVSDARSRVQDSTSNLQEQARIVLDEGKTKVNEAVEKGKQKVEDISSKEL
jgi:gas vesicle protein